MKTTLLTLATLLFSAQVYATATIRIPIALMDDNEAPIATKTVNAKLKAAGLPLVPAYIEVSNNENGHEKVNASLNAISHSLEGIGLKDVSFQNQYDTPVAGTCYKGNPLELADLIKSLADSFYSDQLSMWGYKYKNQTYIDNQDVEETSEYLNSQSEVWKNWNSQNEDILFTFATTDSGDDVNESLIVPCK